MILVAVLCILVVLGGFGAVLRLLSHSSYRELDSVNAHLRAIAVGEVAFARVLGRLSRTGWSDRWFRDAAAVERDVPVAGGTYSCLLRNTPAPVTSPDPLQASGIASPQQADLLVRASYQHASVVLFWRLAMPRGSLDGLSRVIPTFFAFGPDGTPATPAGADPIGEDVNRLIREREANRPRSEDLRDPLSRATSTPEIAGVLGHAPAGPPLDELPPPSGIGPGLPLPPVVTEVQELEGQRPSVGPPPPPTPTPPGSGPGFNVRLRKAICLGARSRNPSAMELLGGARMAYSYTMRAEALGEPVSSTSPDPEMQRNYATGDNYIRVVQSLFPGIPLENLTCP